LIAVSTVIRSRDAHQALSALSERRAGPNPFKQKQKGRPVGALLA